MTKIIIAFYKQNRPLNPNIIFTEERLGGRLYIPNKQINRQTFISYWEIETRATGYQRTGKYRQQPK